jgi:hypothetical protein
MKLGQDFVDGLDYCSVLDLVEAVLQAFQRLTGLYGDLGDDEGSPCVYFFDDLDRRRVLKSGLDVEGGQTCIPRAP